MKKFTRFFATVAAVSMVAASLAGCGSKSDNTASTDSRAPGVNSNGKRSGNGVSAGFLWRGAYPEAARDAAPVL